jgi:hypothetical protein
MLTLLPRRQDEKQEQEPDSSLITCVPFNA